MMNISLLSYLLYRGGRKGSASALRRLRGSGEERDGHRLQSSWSRRGRRSRDRIRDRNSRNGVDLNR